MCGIITFAICTLFATSLQCEEVSCERFPDADSVTINECERVKYNPDGTYEQTEECWTKILTEKGRRSESSLSLSYSRRYGEAAIVYVGAIDANGNEREIDVSATTKEATDNRSMSSNIYDPLDRKLVCTIPGLKIGEILHVKTRRKANKPRCINVWSDISIMEWVRPILKSTYEIIAPPQRPLKKIEICHPLGNVVTNITKLADGSLLHTFTATNSPQAFPEPDMPPLYTQVQHIRVSTASDWPEISKWYWDLCLPHLEKTNVAISNKVAEIGHDINGIFKFVSQEVRYMGLMMEDTAPGYSPHDVDITFNNRYGVCRDKAALLVAMLRIAGYKAYPVLIHAGAKMDENVPSPYFNHAIVAVDRGDYDYVLMDPTNENTKDLFPAYLCNRSYLVARPEGDGLRTSSVPSPNDNGVIANSSGTVMKDGSIFLQNEIRFEGINDTAYRHALVRRKPEDQVKMFENILKAIAPGADLISCEIEPKDMRDTNKPIVIKIASKMPEMILRGETQSELNVPFVTRALGMVNFLLSGSTSLDHRRFPLSLDTTASVVETLKLNLADSSLGRAIDIPKYHQSEDVGYKCCREFVVTNAEMIAKRTATIDKVEFSPTAYDALREEIKRVEASERKRPVFEEDGLKEADVKILLDSSETTITSDSSWVTTNVVTKQVLTYEGKKRSAELKYLYNPMVGNVELISAVVSNRDGRVYSVANKEKNIMDCGWAASAPRYPASKLLVVNLPSVEIGSVITYSVVQVITNAPAAFYAAYAFDSYEPLDRKVVRVNDWRREVVSPRRLPNEPNQPAASVWRDYEIISSNQFNKIDLKLSSVSLPELGEQVSIKDVRDWMAKYVKVVGPGLYELPLANQLTDPEIVLKERYATRLDYIRTMCAVMRGVGYDADVVFAASDANDAASVRHRIMYEQPNVRAFSSPLCRVRVKSGGFLGFGGDETLYYIGTENQYAPLGPTTWEGADYFDPTTAEFGVVTIPDAKFSDFEKEKSEYIVRWDGSVDLVVEKLYQGSGVGAFRKLYSEILPEDKSRRHQEILGAIAQAASATSELETDVESYPASMKFSCYIPEFAVIQGDLLTIQLPPLDSSIPTCIGTARKTPFVVGANDCAEEEVIIRLPEGYTQIESLPKPFTFSNPKNSKEVWMESLVSTEMVEGRLVVKLSRIVHKRDNNWYNPTFYELIKDWGRIARSRANRTIVVRLSSHPLQSR